MDFLLPFGIILALPLGMLFAFKSNVGVMFFAACTGLVLLGSLDSTVVTTAAAFVPGEGESYVRLTVVVLSIVFAGLTFKGMTNTSSKLLNLLLAILLAVTLALLLPAATGVSWLLTMTQNEYWQDINEFRSLIIAAGFALSLVVVLTGRQKHHKRGKH